LKPIGLAEEFVDKLKPWGVLVNLRAAGSGEGRSPDAQLHALARGRRMPLVPMEGVEEQVFVFDEFPMDSQVALLKHALVHRAELEGDCGADASGLSRARRGRDLALHEEFAARHPGSPITTPALRSASYSTAAW
jgi:hypothetical protein